MTPQSTHLDEEAVKAAYRGWAPVYDWSFGLVARSARRRAIAEINKLSGQVLELGVGTGLSLPAFKTSLEITGIDLSAAMLEKARERARALDRRTPLLIMDAGRLAFADDSFDAVAAMFVMTVVPDPVAVMSEIQRVLKPGGAAVIVNHFSRDHGIRSAIEHGMARYSHRLGWHPIFPLATVTEAPGFTVVKQEDQFPAGIFTLIVLRKIASPAESAQAFLEKMPASS